MSNQPEPYRHMPLKKNIPIEDEDSDESDYSTQPVSISSNSNGSWCRCSNCGPVPRNIEKKCCLDENYEITNLKDSGFIPEKDCILKCNLITEHVLNDISIHLSWLRQRQYQGFRGDDLLFSLMKPEEYRYHAYRNYIGVMYGYLGRRNRRVIPACVVQYIRGRWPDPMGTYRGYREVDDDEDNDELYSVLEECS